ncbi:hypothetical protein [Methylotuvimicrobium sp. KM1]|uniref:hypothetical protein n=1 Tax=Methylotuvimicrobium sp. KM1 TaxID=3377707 RepID=UPI00384F0980
MSTEREEIANEVFHGIPSDEKLKSMSFSDLAVECGDCPKDSPKFKVIEREMKKHLAKVQAEINLRNVLIGVCIGGLFTIIGAFLGWWLRTCPSCEQIPPASAMQQMENGSLGVQQPIRDVHFQSSIPAVSSQPKPVPSPVENNAQPSQNHP